MDDGSPGADTEEGERSTEVRGLARSAGLNVATGILNQAARLVITLIIGRFLGDVAVGRFYQAFALHELLALFAAGGFKLAVTRFVSVHRVRSEPGELRGILSLGLVAPTLLAVVLAAALAMSASVLATRAFADTALSPLILWVAAVLPATVYTDVALAATQGYGTMRPSALIGFVLEPALRLLLSVAAIAAGFGVEGTIVALVVTNHVAAVAAWWSLRRLAGPSTVARVYRVRELLAFSGRSWASSMAMYTFIWADTLLLGFFASSAVVGVYQVATRIVLLGAIFILPVGTALAPRVARLNEQERGDLLRSSFELVAAWVFRLGMPFFVVLALFPEPLLALFGPEFVAGQAATRILAIGGLIHSATGPADILLTMTGRPGSVVVNNAIALSLNIGLNIWLIPRHGLEGAALAWTMSLLVMNILFVVQMRRHGGVSPFGRGWGKAALAGSLSLLGGALAIPTGSAVAGAAAVFAVYIAAVALLGLDEDEITVIRALRPRSRAEPHDRAGVS